MFLKYLNLLVLLITCTLPIKAFANQKTNNLNFYSNENNNNSIQIKSEYILGPGDNLNIYFEGLNLFTNTYMISLEGYLILPELGNFYASGLTLVELKNVLLEKYKEYVIDPSIEITINSYRPVSVYLSGEVKNPGLYTIIYRSSSGQKLSDPYQMINGRDIVKSLPYTDLLSRLPKIFDVIKGAQESLTMLT